MQEINLYILTEQRGNASGSGRVAYELEMERKGGADVRREYRVYLPDRNRNGAMLEGLCDALENHVLSGKELRMNLYTEAPMMNAQIMNGNIYAWERKGFKKSDGSPVMYSELWESITRNIREKLKERITVFNGLPPDKRQKLEKMFKKP